MRPEVARPRGVLTAIAAWPELSQQLIVLILDDRPDGTMEQVRADAGVETLVRRQIGYVRGRRLWALRALAF
jgi:hypothetical protein